LRIKKIFEVQLANDLKYSFWQVNNKKIARLPALFSDFSTCSTSLILTLKNKALDTEN